MLPAVTITRCPRREGKVGSATITAATVRHDAGRLSPAYVDVHVNHVLVTGQSLAIGVCGGAPVTTTQPFANMMFADPTRRDRVVPLVEGVNREEETMASAFANHVAWMSRTELDARHDLFVSVNGASGTGYGGLRRGTEPYARGLAEVEAAKQWFTSRGQSYLVRAVMNVHGEAEHLDRNPKYRDDLFEWQADYEGDVRAITGQAEVVPMFITQISSFTRYGQATSAIPQAQLQAHAISNGKVVLVGPKYHLAYANDGIHLTGEGYRHMGEDYAKAYRRVVLEGERWEPLRPLSIARSANVITVKLTVPVPPLVLDTSLVGDPGNYGFAYVDAGPTPAITNVAITGPDTIAITLSATPAASERRLRYAWTGTPDANAGPKTGARGNLRDSDDTPSRTGHALYNWCVHFDEPVP